MQGNCVACKRSCTTANTITIERSAPINARAEALGLPQKRYRTPNGQTKFVYQQTGLCDECIAAIIADCKERLA